MAADHVLSGTYPLSDVLGIVVATDGATRGFQSLGVHNAEEFASEAIAGDGAALVDEIRVAGRNHRQQLLDNAIKVHDDATLEAFAITDHD